MDYLKLKKYNKYLDRTIIGIVIAVLLLASVLIYVWVFYLPKKESKSLKVNFINDDNNNLQSLQSNNGVYKTNDPYGNYQKAQLRQFCSQTDTHNSINLPNDFQYQECDIGLKCTSDILKAGPICLADINGNCNNLSDCVPGTDVCLNGKCSIINADNKINTSCKNDSDCQLNLFEDQINNHICLKLPGQNIGFCKVNLFPFDGNCLFDNDCTFIPGHQIKCINNNNFNDTLIGASITDVKPFTQPYLGTSLSIKLYENFNLNILNDSSTNFMLNLVINSTKLANQEEFYPFTISGVSNTTRIIDLVPSEFLPYPYPNFEGVKGVSIFFGDHPNLEKFIGNAINTGGPYGICLDLLPIGSPANIKIANIVIPGISSSLTTILDNRIIQQSRKGLGIGKIGEFCFDKEGADPALGCGYTKYLNENWNLECGYNYNYEEVFLDNLYYNLLPDNFQLQYVGSCMIKNSVQYQTCNNLTQGCIDPNICLPVLDPVTNQQSNYCLTTMRSQFCVDNTNCFNGYTCAGTSCLSNKNNLAIKQTDCFNNSLSSKLDLFIYNKENEQYYKLNLDISNLNSSDNINNITLKMGTCYQTIDNYTQIGITNKSSLPKKLMIYGASSSNGSIKGTIYQLVNNQYSTFKTFNITPSTNNNIYDISLVNDDKIAVVQKRNIQELREIAFKVKNILPTGSEKYIILEDNDYWFNFNMFIQDQEYEFYIYSTQQSNLYNFKAKGIAKIASKIAVDSPINDYFVSTDYQGEIYDISNGFDVFLVVNTNKLSFNNNVYFNSFKNDNNYNQIDTPPLGNNITDNVQVLLPKNFDINNDNYNGIGENFFMLPMVYRNTNAINNPNYEKNNTQIQNGDRIKIKDDFTIFNFIEFNPSDKFEKSITRIGISSNTYLYPEKIQSNSYFDSNSYVNLDNYICNLHSNYLSSQGSVPTFRNSAEAVYNQNFGYNIEDMTKGVSFTVFEDMVNYNINFISFDLISNNNITINDLNNFIGINNGGKLYINNGLNNSFSYNFENNTDINFNFDDNNNVLITSQVEGMSNFSTYLQKVNYQLENISQINTNISDPDYTLFDLTNENNYDYFYQSSFNVNGNNYLNNIKIKYLKQLIVPNAKSLYFDTSIKNNLINKVEENLLNSNSDNNISLFSTFKNNSFIEEDGNINQRILDIDSQNIYSNKAPPIAAYSSLNDFDITITDQKINYSYQGFSDQEYSYVELDNGISLNYTLEKSCLNENTNYITIREPEIIEVFLNNPASEIVLQKQGDNLEDFYVSQIKFGASFAATKVKNKDGKGVYNNQGFNGKSNINNYSINYSNNQLLENVFQTKNIEINRSVVTIDQYNIYVDQNNNIQEFLIIKLNADIDITDPYVINCFNNTNNKWKFWHNNFVELTYYPELNSYFYTNQQQLVIDYPENKNNENLIVIMDGSPLWTSTKGDNYTLPSNFSPSSFNKILINDTVNYDIFNVHDEYFYKKNFSNSTNNIDDLILDINNQPLYKDTQFNWYNLNNINISDLTIPFVELIYNIDRFSTSIISTPGLDNTLNTDSLPNIGTGFFISQSGSSTLLSSGNNVDIQNIISYLPTQTTIKPNKWLLPYGYQNETVINNNNLDILYLNKSVPKKVKIFDIGDNEFYNLYKPNSDNDYYNKGVSSNYTNNSFVYFKKKYVNNFIVNDYTITNFFKELSTFDVVNLIGNNNSDYIYSINNYAEINLNTDNYYLNGITYDSSGNGNFSWKPTDRGDQGGQNFSNKSFVLQLVYRTLGDTKNSTINLSVTYNLISNDSPLNLPLNSNVKITDSSSDYYVDPNKYPEWNFSSNNSSTNSWSYKVSDSPLTKNFEYDPDAIFDVDYTPFNSTSFTYSTTGIGIGKIWGDYDTNNASFNDNILTFSFSTKGKNAVIQFIFDINKINPAGDDINKINLTVSNTRTSSQSFKKEIIDYNNTFRPIYYPFSTVDKYMYGINYVKDSYFDMMFMSISNDNITTENYNVNGKFDIRPKYSSSICLPSGYQNYQNKLYMVNNLFLSSLNTKIISNIEYTKLKLINNFFISNKYYVNINDHNIINTKYKGLGNIEFKITSSPIIIKNQDKANDFNLINYQEIRFPKWFTERYTSRFNSIPKIKSIFTSIRQGNIFNNMVYYPYLSYSTIEDQNTILENDQLLYMTVDVDQKTVLENRGVPYTMSLSLNEISIEQLERIIKFEPYNKFLFTLGYYCNN